MHEKESNTEKSQRRGEVSYRRIIMRMTNNSQITSCMLDYNPSIFQAMQPIQAAQITALLWQATFSKSMSFFQMTTSHLKSAQSFRVKGLISTGV